MKVEHSYLLLQGLPLLFKISGVRRARFLPPPLFSCTNTRVRIKKTLDFDSQYNDDGFVQCCNLNMYMINYVCILRYLRNRASASWPPGIRIALEDGGVGVRGDRASRIANVSCEQITLVHFCSPDTFGHVLRHQRRGGACGVRHERNFPIYLIESKMKSNYFIIHDSISWSIKRSIQKINYKIIQNNISLVRYTKWSMT